MDYDLFTDIEFNEKKGLNCQSRACAIYSYMLRTGTVEKYMGSMSEFEKIYSLRGEPQNYGFSIREKIKSYIIIKM